MGGSIKKLTSQHNKVSVLFLSDGVTSRDNPREGVESRKDSSLKALEILGCSDVEFNDYPDNRLDTVPLLDLCKTVERHIQARQTDIVFTHFPFDLNIDHRVTHEATLVACRPNLNSLVKQLLFFETVSSTNWNFGAKNFSPNFFIDVTEYFDSKIIALKHYSTELNDFPSARSILNIESLANYRGASLGFEKAEAFEVGFIRTI
jgi:LmbE family N-acetylglucosaminyl deacetylase